MIKTEEEGSSFSQAVILDDENNEIHQLKQFPFSSEYARSSVLVRTVSQDGESIGDLEVLVKGRDSRTISSRPSWSTMPKQFLSPSKPVRLGLFEIN